MTEPMGHAGEGPGEETGRRGEEGRQALPQRPRREPRVRHVRTGSLGSPLFPPPQEERPRPERPQQQQQPQRRGSLRAADALRWHQEAAIRASGTLQAVARAAAPQNREPGTALGAVAGAATTEEEASEDMDTSLPGRLDGKDTEAMEVHVARPRSEVGQMDAEDTAAPHFERQAAEARGDCGLRVAHPDTGQQQQQQQTAASEHRTLGGHCVTEPAALVGGGGRSRVTESALEGDREHGTGPQQRTVRRGMGELRVATGAHARDRSRSPVERGPREGSGHCQAQPGRGAGTGGAPPPRSVDPPAARPAPRGLEGTQEGGGNENPQAGPSGLRPQTAGQSEAPGDEPASGERAPQPEPQAAGTTQGPVGAGRQTYASVAQGEGARRVGGVASAAAAAKAGSVRAQLQAELDALEDDAFLQAFFEEMPRQRDRRQRFVVRLRYRGRHPETFDVDWVELDFLEGALGLQREGGEVKAVIAPPGIPEIDVCFHNEGGYMKFWRRCRALEGEEARMLDDIALIPLFRGETKVVTVSFRTAEIPLEDVTYWLDQRCKVLLGAQHTRDHNGYLNGGSRAIVVLDRDPVSGWIRHLPKYLFMGADRGVVRYGGQPPACYQCGGYDHIRAHCTTELCSKCGVRGHRTATCRRLPTCTLCRQVGHAYLYCPESETNRSDPEAFERDKARMREAEEKRRAAERAWEESRQANQWAAAAEEAERRDREERARQQAGRTGSTGGGERAGPSSDSRGTGPRAASAPQDAARRTGGHNEPGTSQQSWQTVRGGARRTPGGPAGQEPRPPRRAPPQPAPARTQSGTGGSDDGNSGGSEEEEEEEEAVASKGPHAPSNSRQRRQQRREQARRRPGGGAGQGTAQAAEEQGGEEAVQEQMVQRNRYAVLRTGGDPQDSEENNEGGAGSSSEDGTGDMEVQEGAGPLHRRVLRKRTRPRKGDEEASSLSVGEGEDDEGRTEGGREPATNKETTGENSSSRPQSVVDQGKSTGRARKGKKKRRKESPQAASVQDDAGASDRQAGTLPGRGKDRGKDGGEGLRRRKDQQARRAELLETLCGLSHTLHVLETRGQAPGDARGDGPAGHQRQLQEEMERVRAELRGVEAEMRNPRNAPSGAGEAHEEEGPPKPPDIESGEGPAATSDPLAEATLEASPSAEPGRRPPPQGVDKNQTPKEHQQEPEKAARGSAAPAPEGALEGGEPDAQQQQQKQHTGR